MTSFSGPGRRQLEEGGSEVERGLDAEEVCFKNRYKRTLSFPNR